MMEKGRMQRPKRMELHEVDANGNIVGIVICDEETAKKKKLIKKNIERMSENERSKIKR
jgi:hypothetical protein